ncbi:biogenesis of lysosomal organelles complex 1 subunit pallidin [Brevipalpus obovatus]|uniref:biogenesis of lysosomal organelles complex 1 subunit pallidin n=1 Tax=Brevipalpus obovatus TaxID=246614 RepID=UPI003D9F619D
MSFEELLKYQNSLIESLQHRNQSLHESTKSVDLDSMVFKANQYVIKLTNIKKDMETIKERSERNKRRALKLQEQQRDYALEKELRRDEMIQREKQLAPIIVKNAQKNQDDG